MDIYGKILFNTFDVKIKDSEYIINSKNRWIDVYNNEYYRDLIYKDSITTQYIFTLLEPKYKKTKVSFWYETANNMFFSQETRDRLWNIFTKSQKQYYVLSKFVNICKYKYMKLKVDCDLNLNKIVFPSTNVLKIYQDGALYYFAINDIINICNSALTFSYHFFSEAYVPKNPYTNNNFTYPILLKIYYSVRFSSFKMPLLLEMFYRSNFNIKQFKKTNDYFIREECIKSFMKNADQDEQIEYIEEMLDTKENKRMFSFDEDFPKDVLLKAFRPYLFVYLISKYSLRSSRKMFEYKSILKTSLRAFKKENIPFGRKIIKMHKTWSHRLNKFILHKKEIIVTDFKESSIKLPTFRQLISDIVFKEDSDSDSESSDSDDETVENRIVSTFFSGVSSQILETPRTPSISSSDDTITEQFLHRSSLYAGGSIGDIASSTSDSDDDGVEIIINNSSFPMDIEDLNDELNDTDSVS
jgi:hypothetical protein